MVNFINRLKISPVDNNKDDWEVLEMFEVHVKDIRPQNIVVQVPKKFITDGASIPRIFWVYLPRHGKYTKAAVVHDFLYSKKGAIFVQIKTTGFFRSEVTRKEADLIFKKIMKASGVNRVKCWFIYHAVKWFGKIPWYRSKQEEPKGIKFILWCIKVLFINE
jgi:hypothetical protein